MFLPSDAFLNKSLILFIPIPNRDGVFWECCMMLSDALSLLDSGTPPKLPRWNKIEHCLRKSAVTISDFFSFPHFCFLGILFTQISVCLLHRRSSKQLSFRQTHSLCLQGTAKYCDLAALVFGEGRSVIVKFGTYSIFHESS